MKKCFKLFIATAATLVAAASCQKVEEIFEAPKKTHTVKFTTELPAKTSYEVEGAEVHYKWEGDDLDRLHVYEDGVEGTINVYDSAIDETYVMLTVAFEGEEGGSHIYTANLNGGVVKSEQVADGKYDSDCDVLVAKPVSSDEITEDYYTFRFRRPVAITELKLKNLEVGKEVSKVTIISDADHPLIGKYTQGTDDHTTGEWGETSNKIVVTFGTEQDGETPKTQTVEEDGSLIVPIVSMPVENASVKVLVETENGRKYRKVTSAALTLSANNVKVQGIGLNQVSEAEHAEDGWYLVTDASELFDGDEIRIACTSENKMAGDLAIKDDKTQTYLANYEVSFQDGKLTGVTPGSEPQIFTLCEGYDKWNITTANGILGATAAKTLKYNDGTLDWGIGIGDEGVATISSAKDGYGAIKYNASSPRFLNYASGQTDIQIFKKYGNATDPIIKTARTASFSSETATVTIDADDNVYPTLSFDPEEATDGDQKWMSSNLDVATVNETTGEVTLISDGKTTISVEIAESENYQPCNASYELTVKPAEVEGVDYLDRDWTGIEDGSTTYAGWSGKIGSSSGNTYAGNSAGDNNSIQLRTNNSNSGIVVTNSASNQVARKITVDWNTNTSSSRTLDIYGKSTAYIAASDLYSSSTQGTKLGSIAFDTSTELTITGDYKYIGIRSNSGALYLNWIKIQWEDPKPEYEACFKNAGGTDVTEVNATVGEVFSAPELYKAGQKVVPAMGDPAFRSSNVKVATVNEWGVVTIIKKGDAVITATLNGDATHKTTEVSYTIHVANVLSSIEITTEPTKKSYYVGDAADYSGIEVQANYNDKTFAEVAFNDLIFSGFDSSKANPEQEITVSYTENEVTATDSYTVEIKAASTLFDIDVTGAADANGNSVTVEGNKEKAEENDEITLNVNLATGYKLTSLKVNEVEHSADVAEGKYTFTMPAAEVTVTAEFGHLQDVTYFHESFNTNDGTGGNDGEWSGNIASNTLTADNNGWTFVNGGGANTCAKFGSGSKKGSAETPEINISTMTAKLMFKAASWDSSSEGTTLNLTATRATLSQTSVTLVKGSWTTYTIDITGINGKVKIKFEAANASNNRFFLDEVYVYYGNAPEMPKDDATWSVDPESISVAVDADGTATIGTNYDGTLSVSSNNEGIATATISGKTITVRGVAEGNTTIIVTGDETEVYNAINKTINVTVTPAGGSDPVTVTWVAQNASDNPGDAKDWFSGSIDANISWAATKGGSNNPKYYNTGTGLRVYNGGTFTVSAANGKKITKIILTFSGTSYTFSSSNTTTPQTYDLSSVESKQWEVSRTCRLQQVEVTYE